MAIVMIEDPVILNQVSANLYYGCWWKEDWCRGSNISSGKKERFNKKAWTWQIIREEELKGFQGRTEERKWKWIFKGENTGFARVNPLIQHGKNDRYRPQMRLLDFSDLHYEYDHPSPCRKTTTTCKVPPTKEYAQAFSVDDDDVRVVPSHQPKFQHIK